MFVRRCHNENANDLEIENEENRIISMKKVKVLLHQFGLRKILDENHHFFWFKII